ncbi:MAG: mechanosensitive ion channel family protein, partial [Candidatus Altimarinota bacterium]
MEIPETIQQLLDTPLWGDTLRTYVVSILVLIGIFIFFRFAFRILFGRLERYASKTGTDLDDALFKMLEYNRWIIFLTLAFIYIDLALKLTPQADTFVSNAGLVITVLLGIRIINFWIQYGIEKANQNKTDAAEQFTIHLLGRVVKALTWVFGGLFLISSFGYNITSLVTGLGIGGIAVALAMQSILGDLISSITIYLDKPFQVGDFIVLGEKMGTVSNIGLKTTRIISLHGEELVISNKKLTESDIQNFGRMMQRRVLFNLSVTYKTPLKKMKKIPAGMQKIIESVPDTRFERTHFKFFADSAKIFEIVFFVKSKDHQV